MSKTSYLLIAIFFLIVVCFFIVSFHFPTATELRIFSGKQKPTSSISQATLALSPAVQTVLPGQTASSDIVIITEGPSSPDTIQLEISYDPYTITPLIVTPGKYFNEQTVLLNTINPNNARITFAVTCTNKPSPCGSDPSQPIAKINYTVNPLAVKKETFLNILPKSIVENEDAQIVLKTVNSKLMIRGIVAPIASPSAAIGQ